MDLLQLDRLVTAKIGFLVFVNNVGPTGIFVWARLKLCVIDEAYFYHRQRPAGCPRYLDCLEQMADADMMMLAVFY